MTTLRARLTSVTGAWEGVYIHPASDGTVPEEHRVHGELPEVWH